MRLRNSSQHQVCPWPAMLNCKLSTNTSSSHNAQRSLFSPKMHSSFLQLDLFEVGSRSHHKQTAPGFIWKRTETTSSRRSRYACLFRFWGAPKCNYWILTCPNEPHQELKRTLVQFNRTKWGRCESTLRSKVCSDWPAIQCVVIGRIPQAWDGNVTALTILWCRVLAQRD